MKEEEQREADQWKHEQIEKARKKGLELPAFEDVYDELKGIRKHDEPLLTDDRANKYVDTTEEDAERQRRIELQAADGDTVVFEMDMETDGTKAAAAAAKVSHVDAGVATTTTTTTTTTNSFEIEQTGIPDAVKVLGTPPRRYYQISNIECSFKEGFITGQVVVRFRDGSVYKGMWQDDESYAHVAGFIPPKTNWQNPLWGCWTMPNGDQWEGEFVDNLFDPLDATGHFVLTCGRTGDIFDGRCCSGKAHGFGHLRFYRKGFADGTYVGEFKHGEKHGHGVMVCEDGEQYDGEWMKGVFHGSGHHIFSDSSRYRGMYEHGHFHGNGGRHCANGDHYEGDFVHGQMHGFGHMRFANDSTQYVGEWCQGLMHGQGTCIQANGERVMGVWNRNMRHGEFKCFEHESLGHEVVSRQGLWEHGFFIKWVTTPISKVVTDAFCQHFVNMDVLNAAGDYNASIRQAELHSEYAVNVSSLLPDVPEGVDPINPVVKFIIHWLARAEASVVGVAAENRLMPLYEKAKQGAANHFQVLQKAKSMCQEAMDYANDYRCVLEKAEDELAKVVLSKVAQEMKIEALWQSDKRNSRLGPSY
jgi:hypothetical protein